MWICLCAVSKGSFEKGLFFEKRVKGLSCFNLFIDVSSRGAPGDKIVAEIRPFLVNDPLCRDLPTLIVGVGIIKFALHAASECPPAMGTLFTPPNPLARLDFTLAKIAMHVYYSSNSKTGSRPAAFFPSLLTSKTAVLCIFSFSSFGEPFRRLYPTKHKTV